MFKSNAIIILLLSSFSIFSQTTVVLNRETNLPDVNYKRGTAAPGMGGFFDNDKTRDYLDYQRSIGMNIFNGIRNLFKDGETNEFYYENGEYKNQQIAKFTSIRKYANSLGFELISQVGGTPRNSNYDFDTTFRKKKAWVFEPDVDFAPIPAAGTSMSEFQRNFAEWAINADKAVGEDFHSIWIGTQEIAHTIGFRDGITNATTKKEAIRRFTNYWKPISDSLRAAGAKTGGIQLNSSNANIYSYAVDYMIQQKLHLDYLTYQFYQWGDTADLLAAVEATKRYSRAYPGTKLIIDRGGHGKLVPDGVSGDADARGVIYFLVGELGAMNHANWVYAFTPDRQINGMNADQNKLLWKTRAWINSTGNKRCRLSGLPAGVDGFAVHNGKKISIALWNRGAGIKTFNILLNDANISYDAHFSSKYASGNAFIPSSITWDAQEQTIKNISLKQFDYVLLDLESSYALSTPDHIEDALFLVYPNPAEHVIHVKAKEDILSLTLTALDGRLVKTIRNQKQMAIDGIESGTYILKLEAGNGATACKKIVVK